MGEVVAVQYLKAESILAVERAQHRLPATGWIKKTVEFGSFTTKMTAISDSPVKDTLKSLSKMKADFSSLKRGDISDIMKK